jgi:enoyl-CoA hydratase
MNFTNLLVEIKDRIATVTVNRPKVLNALNEATLKELDQAFISFENDSEVKVVILTGAGEKAFVAGGDIAVMQPLGPVAARDFARMAQKILDRIENSPKPVIAAINGYALGGGCELAMACDLRIASESARLGQPEINLGIIPGWAGTQRLARLVGKGRAKELLFTGEMIDAREAWRIGLVNRVVPAAELMSAARELAVKIAGSGQGGGQPWSGDGPGARQRLRSRSLRPLLRYRRSERGDAGLPGEAGGGLPRPLIPDAFGLGHARRKCKQAFF